MFNILNSQRIATRISLEEKIFLSDLFIKKRNRNMENYFFFTLEVILLSKLLKLIL